jgi:phosphatidylglycerophosphate synthase
MVDVMIVASHGTDLEAVGMTTNDRTYGESALLTPANMMTAFRLVVAPVFIYLIVVDRISWWTALVGMSAAASDYFDGIVARRHGTTTLGRVPRSRWPTRSSCSGALRADHFSRPTGSRPSSFPAVIITLREIWMSVFRARAAKKGISIPASKLAKWKTFSQDWAIAFCVCR